MNRVPNRSIAGHDGFSLIELMIVLAIIGVLVTTALPVYFATVAKAKQTACFAQQRTIDSVVSTWNASDRGGTSVLTGVVNAAHPLISEGLLKQASRCPSAPPSADPNNPDSSTGAYTLDTNGDVEGCVFGALGAHGRYQ